ncbi:hypothetical protein PIB30_103631 [Stylosanthes scabra]|uniref:Retrovirus-related Pol polyprotein from transposon TNT 1-94-like beta-barrel domain-containing protein n=1 Tax=Stylosanthes scabra TaxID=79078 RepID=A0ABU6XX83_9FABA|nr:hypothetical protein [Stylosanthes scabra]
MRLPKRSAATAQVAAAVDASSPSSLCALAQRDRGTSSHSSDSVLGLTQKQHNTLLAFLDRAEAHISAQRDERPSATQTGLLPSPKLDSGATNNVSSNLSWFTYYTQINPITVRMPNGSQVVAHYKGVVAFSPSLIISDESSSLKMIGLDPITHTDPPSQPTDPPRDPITDPDPNPLPPPSTSPTLTPFPLTYSRHRYLVPPSLVPTSPSPSNTLAPGADPVASPEHQPASPSPSPPPSHTTHPPQYLQFPLTTMSHNPHSIAASALPGSPLTLLTTFATHL